MALHFLSHSHAFCDQLRYVWATLFRHFPPRPRAQGTLSDEQLFQRAIVVAEVTEMIFLLSYCWCMLFCSLDYRKCLGFVAWLRLSSCLRLKRRWWRSLRNLNLGRSFSRCVWRGCSLFRWGVRVCRFPLIYFDLDSWPRRRSRSAWLPNPAVVTWSRAQSFLILRPVCSKLQLLPAQRLKWVWVHAFWHW